MKYLCNINYNNFAITGVSDSQNPLDTDDYCFSFIVFGVTPEDFIKEIQKCQAMREAGDMKTYSVVLNEHNTRDNLRILYQGGYVSITRGNCKVLFHGSLGVIHGAVQSIAKTTSKE